jgi:hypothetical protein
MMTKMTEEVVQRVTVDRFNANRLDQGDPLPARLAARVGVASHSQCACGATP